MEELVPSEFYLSQNFPNPFKDSTKIKYCLPVKTDVNLTVYNSVGEKVKELVNTMQEAGTYEIKLGSGDFPNGSYYYRIQAVDPLTNSSQPFVETKKMILLREDERSKGKTVSRPK